VHQSVGLSLGVDLSAWLALFLSSVYFRIQGSSRSLELDTKIFSALVIYRRYFLWTCIRKMMVPAAVARLVGRPDYSSSRSNLSSSSSWTRSTTRAKNLEEEGHGRRAATIRKRTLRSATEGSSSTRSATTTITKSLTTTTCSTTPSEPPARRRRQRCRTL